MHSLNETSCQRPLHIIMLGLRGLPGVQGGVETHVENLSWRLALRGCLVEVFGRSRYQQNFGSKGWRGVRIRRIWSPITSGAEAFVHTFLGVLVAGVVRPDVLHIHAVGPAIWAPLARLLGLKVVVTHHGPDYSREKWGRFARWILRFGERLGVEFSSEVIVISKSIHELVKEKYNRVTPIVPNGVNLPKLHESSEGISRWGLHDRKYVLMVSRFVPEKRQLDLIEAFRRAGVEGWKLVLVGALDSSDQYTNRVVESSRNDAAIVLTGFQRGQDLDALYSHAGLFVLPSTHEGLPIALLEALSFGLPVVASDIPANVEIGLPSDSYFRVGDVGALADCIRSHADSSNLSADAIEARRSMVETLYNWDCVSMRTLNIYRDVVYSRQSVVL